LPESIAAGIGIGGAGRSSSRQKANSWDFGWLLRVGKMDIGRD
jgi:hypothetical protein